MRSIDHQGVFFDNLSFSNFGYGGDPNDVSRLRIEKNKWYDFRALFRRDKNIWNYNLLANPLNPASFNPGDSDRQFAARAGFVPPDAGLRSDSSPAIADPLPVGIFPQRRQRTRSSPRSKAETEPLLLRERARTPQTPTAWEWITGAFRKRRCPSMNCSPTPRSTTARRTIIFLYQLSNGTPVDLGIVFVGTSPCAKPVTNAATTPPTVTANCNGYLSYSQVQNPRSSFPTERFSFQSTYIKNLSMTGSVGYSSGNNTVSDFNEAINGWASQDGHAREHDRRPGARPSGFPSTRIGRATTG